MHAYAAALGLLPAVAYAAGVLQLQRRGDRWPKGRTAAFAAGTVCLAIALGWPHTHRFEAHVAQHLLLSSLAPLLLVLGTPVTLALRTLPRIPRQGLLRVLHSPLARLATNPAVVLMLVLGGLYGFYLTPLYAAAQHNTLLHIAGHGHMLLAGCLLSWLVVGADPMPRRPRVRTRLALLVLVAGGHDVLAKLLYAHALPAGAGSAEQIQAGAQLLYYGGTLGEVLLAIAVLAGWYARSGRELARERARLRAAAA